MYRSEIKAMQNEWAAKWEIFNVKILFPGYEEERELVGDVAEDETC
jgi:hypothetical protein